MNVKIESQFKTSTYMNRGNESQFRNSIHINGKLSRDSFDRFKSIEVFNRNSFYWIKWIMVLNRDSLLRHKKPGFESRFIFPIQINSDFKLRFIFSTELDRGSKSRFMWIRFTRIGRTESWFILSIQMNIYIHVYPHERKCAWIGRKIRRTHFSWKLNRKLESRFKMLSRVSPCE